MKAKWVRMGLALAMCAAAMYMTVDLAAADELPPRPGAAANASVTGPELAHIELRAAVAIGTPTVVQWRDAGEHWHDVDGWRLPVQSSGKVTWAVWPRDFATGPFRWVTYDPSTRAVLAASKPFFLPCCSGSTLIVEIW